MTGISSQAQLAMLQSTAVGLGTSGSPRNLYIHFFKSTLGAGDEPNENGTLPATLSEVTIGNGYAPILFTSAAITFAQGPPTTAAFPTSGTLGCTAAGASFGTITAIGISPDSGAWVPANSLYTGPLVDGSGNPIAQPIGDGSRLEFTATNQILIRLGDPAKVADATAGTQRTVPI